MGTPEIRAALQRAEAILQRKPEAGLHDDPPALARWRGGAAVETSDPEGRSVRTDMPAVFGGDGQGFAPGWLFRAGLASCCATRIAMQAALDGIALDLLEVQAGSRSDTRGLLGMADGEGHAVDCGPSDLQLQVRVAAQGVAPQRLRELVERSHRHSPVSRGAQQALPLALHIVVDAD